jgi:hypothetical protein
MRSVAAIALLAAACYNPTVPFGAPCATNRECPTGQECDVISNTCTPPNDQLTWTDDTAADFAQSTAVLRDATVESAGFVGPMPYVTGRVRYSGVDDTLVPDPAANATWANIGSPAITGRGFRDLDVSFGGDTPQELGLSSGDDITILVEGEIYLDAPGNWQFELQANDVGFVEIAAPGGAFTPLLTSDNGAETASFSAPAAGWYGIRGAFTDRNMAMSFELRYDPPNVPGGFRDIPSDRLRARADGLAGYIIDGYEEPQMLGPGGSTVAVDALMGPYGDDPFGLRIGNRSYTMRWSGQVLVDIEGDYAFRLDSLHGHRMWIDGTQLANAFGSTAQISNTAPIHLVKGWHDIVVDLTKSDTSSNTRMIVTVTAGPAWVGQGIPGDHVRPVMGRQIRHTTSSNGSIVEIPDGAGVTITQGVNVDVPAGTIQGITVGYEMDHPLLATTSVDLVPPVGATIPLHAIGGVMGSGSYFAVATVPVASAGSAWGFIIADNTTDTMIGDIILVSVTMLVANTVEKPFPPSWRYESQVKELGDVIAFGTMRWALRQGTDATVQLRTCDDAAGCASEPWTKLEQDAAPSVMPRRFAQYAVEMMTDGDVPSALDAIELQYSIRE